MLRVVTILAVAVALGACSADPIDGDTKREGVTLVVSYDSSLDVRRLAYTGTIDGAPVPADGFEAPLFLEPPGVRSVEHLVALPGSGLLELRVDGLDLDDDIIGSGVARAPIDVTANDVVRVRLGAPIACGDGLINGLETCDDGNVIAGDGCNATCELEPDAGPRVVETEALDLQAIETPQFTDVPGAGLEVPSAAPEDTWLVFVSGRMRSTEEAEYSAELRLLLDDEEADLLGHQTDLGEDNWAGFLTFVAFAGTATTVDVRVQFRAEVGRTEVADLRIVGLRLLPNADVHLIDERGELETAGARVDVATVTVSPDETSDWIVLAKASASEQPSDMTVRTWLEVPGGQRLPDDSGVGYANPRDTWAPMFVAQRATLDAGDNTYTLRGASSSAGDTGAWWDTSYDHREVIGVTAGATVAPDGYAISVTFDHAAWVAAGESNADGRDVRIVYNGVQIDRVLDPSSTWNSVDTRVWFAVQTGLAPNEEDKGYELYHGRVAPPDPPEDSSAIFTTFEPFDGTTLDTQRWVVLRGEPTVGGGQLTVGPGTLLGLGNRTYGPNTIVESSTQLSSSTGDKMRWLAFFAEATPAMSFHTDNSDQHATTRGNTTHFVLDDVTMQMHRYGIARQSSVAVRYLVDGSEAAVHRNMALPVDQFAVGMDNTTPDQQMTYDWILVRPYVYPEPTTTISRTGSLHGGSPSRWRHRRIIAFRANALSSLSYAETRAGIDVTTPDFTPLVRLETEAEDDEADFVVLQSERVSGAATGGARKVGELRRDGDVVLATSHVTSRGSATVAGFHHTAGVVDARRSPDAAVYENGCRSPDGIVVRCADAVVMVLRP